ncbi:cytochrome P450 [Xylariaceae sp. FL0662B]|nr:cytochrome P450 [Xylariaceae sp. FL0662B]
MDKLSENISWTKQLGQSWVDDLQTWNSQGRDLSPIVVLKLVITATIVISTSQVIYNLYFHPLANYPGPFWARASTLWRFWSSLSGQFHRIIEDSHRKYGPVFRVGPNELSFASATAYKTIYGTKNPAPKNEYFAMFAAGYKEPCVATERDPHKAGEKRALFTTAFTQRALLQQESIVQRCVDEFIIKVGQLGSGPKGIEIGHWYDMVSFDIFGALAFGESFHCIKREASHPWLDMMLDHLLVIVIMDNLRRYPLLVALARTIPAKWTTGLAAKHNAFAMDKVKRRLAQTENPKDFLSRVVDKVKAGEVSEDEMVAHSSTLVVAGGETTSTAMAATTFYLLKYPHTYERLKSEVRARYNNLQEIDIMSTAQIPYLQGVIKEGLRLFPPASQGMPRRSPGMTVDGYYVPEGTEFYVSTWATSRLEQYFHDAPIFKPERWIDPDCHDVKEASQPFSLGPRVCIGKAFAYAQMSVELAKLTWKYDMELVYPDRDFEAESGNFFQWRKSKLYVRLSERA